MHGKINEEHYYISAAGHARLGTPGPGRSVGSGGSCPAVPVRDPPDPPNPPDPLEALQTLDAQNDLQWLTV